MSTAVLEKIKSGKDTLTSWMNHMHKTPELALKETGTAKFIAERLREIGGWEIVEGVGKTGIVASMKVGDSEKSIGLRADFDALPIEEDNNLPYKSTVPGNAHLCGHDGHTTMLLGAAKYLAETKNFNGTVRLFFQPGEETMEGAPAMIADGLFEALCRLPGHGRGTRLPLLKGPLGTLGTLHQPFFRSGCPDSIAIKAYHAMQVSCTQVHLMP